MDSTHKSSVELTVNDKKALERLNELETKAKKLHKEFDEAFKRNDTKGIKDTAKALDKVNREMAQIRTNAQNINEAMKSLNTATPKQLQKTIKLINAELNSGRVPRGSKQWQEYTEQLKRVKAELNRVNAEMRGTKSLLSSLKDKFNDWGAAAAGAFAAVAGTVLAGRSAVQKYADMEESMANTVKYTRMTADEVDKLNDIFKKTDTRLAREQLNLLAQEGGRLGYNTIEKVGEYVDAASQINVALVDLGEGATQTIAKLSNIFGMEEMYGVRDAMLKIGSTVNHLSQNCTAAKPYIVEFAQRMAGIGSTAKMTIPDIMALAATLDAHGQKVEMSATAVQRTIMDLYKAPADMAKKVGLDVKVFTDTLNKNTMQGLLMFLDALHSIGDDKALAVLSPLFKDLGLDGARVTSVLSNLSSHLEFLKWQMGEAAEAFEKGTSASNEYAIFNNTVQAQIDKAKKKFEELTVELGEKLYPVMKHVLTGSSMLMRTIKILVDSFIKWRVPIISATTALIAYNIAIEASTIKTKALGAWTAICTTAKKAWAATTYLAAAATNAFTGNVKRANAAMMLFNRTTKANPIGLLVAALAAATTAIIAFASKSKEAVSVNKMLADAEKSAAKNAATEMAETDALYKKTQDLNASMKTRLAAAERLKEMHPDTFNNLTAEAIVAGQAAQAYALLAENIEKSALSSAYRKKLEDNASALADAITAKDELLESLKKSNVVGDIVKQDIDEAEKIKQLQEWATNSKKWIASSYNVGGTTGNNENTRNMIDRLVTLSKSIDDYNNIASGIADKISSIESTISRPETTEVQSDYITTPGGKEEKESDRKKRIQAALDAEKSRIEQEEALNAIAYATGQRNYEYYINKKKILEMGLLDNQIIVLEELGETDSKLYADLLLQRAELQAKYANDAKAKSVAELESQYEEQKSLLADMYADVNSEMYLNDQAYKQAMFQAEVDFLKKKIELYKDNAKERAKIEKELANLINKDQVDKAKKFNDQRKAFEQKYLEDKRGAYLKALAEIDKREADGVITAKEATHARLQELAKQLSSIGQDFSATIVSLGDTIYSFVNDLGAKTEDIVSSAFGVMAAALSSFSALTKAEQDLEIAKIEKRYDTEIEAAGKNKKKVAELEKRKEAEVASVKKKYNDRAMKIEIAQAIAQTAQAAIAAYASAAAIPVTGWVMAPIAAGLATAAGLLQVATIKKQHEAQAAGYYSGGFTGGHDYRKEVGVVHGGEFVANHDAVNNPNLLPLLKLIDYAQRNNTVGALSAEDISIALAQGRGVSARGEASSSSVSNTTVNNVIDVAALDRLNAILDRGINAIIPLDGNRGFDHQYTKYKQLQSNPNR